PVLEVAERPGSRYPECRAIEVVVERLRTVDIVRQLVRPLLQLAVQRVVRARRDVDPLSRSRGVDARGALVGGDDTQRLVAERRRLIARGDVRQVRAVLIA